MTARTNKLFDRMIALADSGHPRADDLRKAAMALDAATEGENMKRMLGCWARCRLLWKEITGEALV